MKGSAFKRGMAAAWAICALSGATPATAQQTIRVGWTIPAEESKYWMMKRPAEFPELGKTYLLKDDDFGRDPGAAPNFPAIQTMLDTYADTGMLPKKMDLAQFKHPAIVAPLK